MTDARKETANTSASNDQHESLRDRAAHAYENAVARAGDTAGSSREAVRDAAHQAGDFVDTNPLGVLAGGLALGALVGALVPRSEREKQILAPMGKKIGMAAVAALAAAKEAGRGELEELGLTKDGAKEQAKSLLQGVATAASNAGNAAAEAGREQIKTAH
ncbi:hypothetical protein LQ954_02715 [Sphingomonas sp. IC-11]|uniref:hypothetical protein n=1 Tax=Sphingomonas sp. IC-11 TaxID=2898528 RepID=UPI001E2B95A1|nr:hypothetical protein [Sphingomonas sp. IC-11]MCD2315058.1 hypothetical protein [Sphingomonas sp. IC-11]